VPDFVTCFACDQEPTRQCSRCGRPYCDEHGEELCDACLEPASGVPSFTLYRGSLLALIIGSALALWLLIQPADSGGDGTQRAVVLTPTSPAARASVSPGTQPTQAAGGGQAATPVAGTATPRPTNTPASGGGSYTVASGDNLSSICAAQRPALNNGDCVQQLRARNGLTGDALSVGQTLVLP
jgi:hypothetical protein